MVLRYRTRVIGDPAACYRTYPSRPPRRRDYRYLEVRSGGSDSAPSGLAALEIAY
jgi:hypothetical protein